MEKLKPSRLATWGLFMAWAVHDVEELVTMPGWVQRSRPRLERALPWVPAQVWDKASVDREHTTLAVALMGSLMVIAAASGALSGGRSALYQTALAGFGIHAISHLGSAAATKGYTPGVITAPLIVAPFSWWAWRELKATNVPAAGASFAHIALVLASIPLAHAGASFLLKRRTREESVTN